MCFGGKLRALRQSRRMTQAQLALALGVTKRTLINYEQGRCCPKQTEVFARIAALFDVSVDYLMSGEDEALPEARRGPRPVAQEIQRLLSEAGSLFAGVRLDEEDRDKVMRAIGELYRKVNKNNGKFAPKTRRGDAGT